MNYNLMNNLNISSSNNYFEFENLLYSRRNVEFNTKDSNAIMQYIHAWIILEHST